ncbi:MAG TPA: hypothetical protein VM938_14930 [Acidimicrobiales bacterium]|nr:hypothetical protein [Acidimicrobiales bacterium]
MQRGEVPKASRTRIRLVRWALVVVGLALNLGLSFGTDLYRGDEATRADKAAATRALVSAADLGEGWVTESGEDAGVTVGLTEGEAECLGVDFAEPEFERGSSFFSKGDMTLAAWVAVWPDEVAAAAVRDAMARPDYPPCLVAQLQSEQDEESSDRARVSMLASPASPDPTVQRFSVDYRWPDGSTQTSETYQAFKGRFQVVVLAWAPGDVDQAPALDLVRKMLARLG